MNIRVIQEGKTNTYKLGEVKGVAYRKYLVSKDSTIEASKTNNYTAEIFDMSVDFIVSAFNNQFTADELLESMNTEDIFILGLQIDAELSKKIENKVKKLASTL